LSDNAEPLHPASSMAGMSKTAKIHLYDFMINLPSSLLILQIRRMLSAEIFLFRGSFWVSHSLFTSFEDSIASEDDSKMKFWKLVRIC